MQGNRIIAVDIPSLIMNNGTVCYIYKLGDIHIFLYYYIVSESQVLRLHPCSRRTWGHFPCERKNVPSFLYIKMDFITTNINEVFV